MKSSKARTMNVSDFSWESVFKFPFTKDDGNKVLISLVLTSEELESRYRQMVLKAYLIWFLIERISNFSLETELVIPSFVHSWKRLILSHMFHKDISLLARKCSASLQKVLILSEKVISLMNLRSLLDAIEA